MVRTQIGDTGRRAFHESAAGISPARLAQFKLERLFELRAVIDALRGERNAEPASGNQARARQ
jgi:hypothetical protein